MIASYCKEKDDDDGNISYPPPPKKKKKNVEKGENALTQHVLLFLQCILPYERQIALFGPQ